MKKNNSARVFVIGLDGATFDLIKPWVKEGKLPTFSRLFKEGVYGDLESTLPPVTCPAWPSFITGKNPAKHGLFDFGKRKPNSYYNRPVNYNDIDSLTIFEILSQENKFVGALNLPVTYPPPPVNGFLVSGLLSPGENCFTYPSELAKQLQKMNYQVECPIVYNGSNQDELIKSVYQMTEKRKEATLFLMNQYPWDLFIVVFRGPDIIQHNLWRHLDPAHPFYNPKYQSTFLDFYQYLDQVIKELIEQLDEKIHLIVMSDHGFGPLKKHVHLDNWLIKNSYMYYKRAPMTQLKRLIHRFGFNIRTIFRFLSGVKIQNITFKISREYRNKILRKLLSFDDIDWSRTKAYSLGHMGQIFIKSSPNTSSLCDEDEGETKLW